MKNRQAASLADAFERALDAIRTRVPVPGAVAVAYSGGLDSAALLHLAHDYARSRGIELFAFHIHHGISGNADDWFKHCERACASLSVRFGGLRVRLADVETQGVEAAARQARYAALGELCRQHRVPLLITAHHRDDQAETVLLQLLRGSGIAGLSGMETANTAPDLLGDPDLIVGRPLLNVPRAELADFVVGRAIPYVEDESNNDPHYARNALRHHVMPALAEYFPGFQQRLVRAAGHAKSAQHMLSELAEQDLAQCRDHDCIDIRRLKRLGSRRIDNLLRFWFASRGIRMPSTSWLSEMRVQLLEAREGAQVRVTHADCEIRRYREKIYLTPRQVDAEPVGSSPTFRWNGEPCLRFDAFGGSLHFEPAEQGIDAAWLRGQYLHLRFRQGGEKLKAAPDRPSRSLKHHYQALDIPAWERGQLPLLIAGDKLLFAAGIGINWRDLPSGQGTCLSLHWESMATPDF